MIASLVAGLLLLLAPFTAFGQTKNPDPIHLLTIEGVISPLSARYLSNGIREAHAVGAQAVVLKLNTPGGLETSMREMVQVILNAPIPIIVYVAPSGARAASAGMFITIAAPIAVMAPGTNIGAAHPVTIGGGAGEEGERADARIEKAVNDAAAFARTIASKRGRNSKWAEQAVLESVSITETEAVRLKVVDLIAPDVESLLASIDGRKIELTSGSVVLTTKEARIIERPMNFAERILQFIVDPNVAFLLMSIGFIGILAELYNPGMILPGLTGVIALLLSFTAFGSLPINWAGFALLALAFLLFALELNMGSGVLAAAGVVAFVLGALMLYRPFSPVSPSYPNVHINPGLLVTMTVVVVGFSLGVLRAVLRTTKAPIRSGAQGLKGATGYTVSDLNPFGFVRVDSEDWSAVAEPDTIVIPKGSHVKVVDVQGVTLKVKPLPVVLPRIVERESEA